MRNETMNINAVDALNNTNNTSKTKRDKKKEGDALYKTMDGLRNCVFTNGKGTDLAKFGKLYPLLETLLQDYKTNYGEDGVTRKVSEWLTKSRPYFPTLQAQAQDQDQGGFSVNYEEINKWSKRVYAAQLAISENCMQPYTQGRINEALQNFKALHDAFFTAVSEYYAHVGDDDNITLFRKWYERVKKYMPLLFDEDNETPRNPVQGAETPQIQSQTAQVEQLPTESETVQNNDVSEPLEYSNITNTDVNDETITPKDTTERAEMPQIQSQTAQVEQLPTEDEKTQNNGISEPLEYSNITNTDVNDTSNADVNRDNRPIDEKAFNEFLALLDDE